MMKRLIVFTLLLLLSASCADKGSNNAMPQLTEQKMISILSDLQILEADLTFRKTNQQDIAGLPQLYYEQLFEHHGITDSIFAQNMRYYTERPAVLERIMDSVMQRLTAEQNRKP